MRKCKHPELTALAYAGYAAILRSTEAEEAEEAATAADGTAEEAAPDPTSAE